MKFKDHLIVETNKRLDTLNTLFFNFFASICWTILFFCLVGLGMWPFTHLYLHARITEYSAFQESVRIARLTNTPQMEQELRGVQVEIAKWNGWRAYWQAWDQAPIIQAFIPSEINELKPME